MLKNPASGAAESSIRVSSVPPPEQIELLDLMDRKLDGAIVTGSLATCIAGETGGEDSDSLDCFAAAALCSNNRKLLSLP
jgi:hypothetical protein